jgi:hypothetical protein
VQGLPVIQELRLESRRQIASATSPGCPIRPSGDWSQAAICSVDSRERSIGVSTEPGANVFTLISDGPSSSTKTLRIASTRLGRQARAILDSLGVDLDLEVAVLAGELLHLDDGGAGAEQIADEGADSRPRAAMFPLDESASDVYLLITTDDHPGNVIGALDGQVTGEAGWRRSARAARGWCGTTTREHCRRLCAWVLEVDHVLHGRLLVISCPRVGRVRLALAARRSASSKGPSTGAGASLSDPMPV